MSYASRFTRECMKPGYRSLGPLVVAANMLKIIGLVALSIPDAEAIERLLIARSRPVTHANRERIFFSHSLNIVDAIIIAEIAESSVVEWKWKFIRE